MMTEHFCTLFDKNFLPMGIALHSSLMRHMSDFCLWVICTDEDVEKQLAQLNLPKLKTIALRDVENEALLSVKPGRTRGEYCWTLSSFTFQAVFDRDAAVQRVTYLDADLFFFDSPKSFFEEFEQSGKDVLITEHAYDPHYEQSATSGRFCVQYLTAKRTAGGLKVLKWWQDRVIEWCFARFEDGKFGDQKYLDVWPELFKNEVHILKQEEKTLAPWNVLYFERKQNNHISPVFYHFHSLRITTPSKIRLFSGYKIGADGLKLYETYVAAIRAAAILLRNYDIILPTLPIVKKKFQWLRTLRAQLRGRERFARL